MIRNAMGAHIIPDIPKDTPDCLFCADSGFDGNCTDSEGRREWRFCAACAEGFTALKKDPFACDQMNAALRALEKKVSK
jgi:hypothetical protein